MNQPGQQTRGQNTERLHAAAPALNVKFYEKFPESICRVKRCYFNIHAEVGAGYRVGARCIAVVSAADWIGPGGAATGRGSQGWLAAGTGTRDYGDLNRLFLSEGLAAPI